MLELLVSALAGASVAFKPDARCWPRCVVAGMLDNRPVEGEHMVSAVFVVLAVSTGLVVIAVAVAVVLVVLIVALSMRGRQQRAAQRRGEARRDEHEAHDRVRRAEHSRGTVHGGEEDRGLDR
jgi:uncharacterized membrane protein